MSQGHHTPKKLAAITAVLGLLSIFPPLATDMYLAAIGDMAEAMQASDAAAELSLSLFFLGLCAGQLVIGPLIDGFGRKGPLLAGAGLFVATSFAMVVVDDIALFNALRFLQAVGACAGMVVGRAVVNDLYEGREAAKVMTTLVMLLTLGPIISPTLGSLLLTTFGWRSIFVAMVVIGATALALSKLVLPETLAVADRKPAPFRAALQSGKTLLSGKTFATMALVGGLVQGGMFAFITGSSGVFQSVFGLDPLQFGLVFALVAGALLISGQINKRLLDRFAPEQILGAGLPAYVALSLVLVLCSGTAHLWLLLLPLWLSIGMVGLLSANAMSLTMAAAKGSAGTGSALLGAIQFAIAFTVSSLVALGGTHTPLPMALGLFLPATLALVLYRRADRAPAAEAPLGQS